uniref:Uncharacterized protein n=1 Tax=Magallana gigas TaxID=29159 RepID=K1QA30_MAGGI
MVILPGVSDPRLSFSGYKREAIVHTLSGMFCVKDNEEILAGLLENFVLFLDEKSEEPSTMCVYRMTVFLG